MEWTVYNFECADADAREALLDWFDETHPLDVPGDDEAVHGPLVDESDAEVPADVAWVAEYVYVLTNQRVAGLLENSASLWDRAIVAEFDGPTETCTEAVLYRSEDGSPVEVAQYEGVPEISGQDMVYRFAMDHQFRFRAYAQDPPTPMITPLFGAFEAVVGMGWGSELMEYFERETGVAPTGQGLAFLEDDPVLDEGEFYEAADEQEET